MHKGFADLSLATWVRRHNQNGRHTLILRDFGGGDSLKNGRLESGSGKLTASDLWFFEVRARALTGTPVSNPSIVNICPVEPTYNGSFLVAESAA